MDELLHVQLAHGQDLNYLLGKCELLAHQTQRDARNGVHRPNLEQVLKQVILALPQLYPKHLKVLLYVYHHIKPLNHLLLEILVVVSIELFREVADDLLPLYIDEQYLEDGEDLGLVQRRLNGLFHELKDLPNHGIVVYLV